MLKVSAGIWRVLALMPASLSVIWNAPMWIRLQVSVRLFQLNKKRPTVIREVLSEQLLRSMTFYVFYTQGLARLFLTIRGGRWSNSVRKKLFSIFSRNSITKRFQFYLHW